MSKGSGAVLTSTMEQVERVAAAICDADTADGAIKWDKLFGAGKWRWRAMAEAALTAALPAPGDAGELARLREALLNIGERHGLHLGRQTGDEITEDDIKETLDWVWQNPAPAMTADTNHCGQTPTKT